VWLVPDIEHRRQIAQPLFALHTDAYLPHGETYRTADGSGVAVWLPPGAQLQTPEQEEEFGAAVLHLAGPYADRAFLLAETFARHHPTTPHYYLQFLSTEPAYQGRGIGSAFLRQMLHRADREGMPAYHEATTPKNRALYERHGYVAVGEIALPDDGPVVWPMWRDPR
jgi:GNAT superfamily N-acetyltransferase